MFKPPRKTDGVPLSLAGRGGISTQPTRRVIHPIWMFLSSYLPTYLPSGSSRERGSGDGPRLVWTGGEGGYAPPPPVDPSQGRYPPVWGLFNFNSPFSRPPRPALVAVIPPAPALPRVRINPASRICIRILHSTFSNLSSRHRIHQLIPLHGLPA